MTRLLELLRLQGIRSKIIAFAVLATLVPSLTMGWLSYRNSVRSLNEKLAQELTSVTFHASRNLDVWLKERRYDVRVFASSYEVSENLERLAGTGGDGAARERSLSRLRDYLQSVEQRFADYTELVVLDNDGRAVASSAESIELLDPSRDWLDTALSGEPALGAAHRDPRTGSGIVTVAQPVIASTDEVVGVLVAKVDLRRIGRLLRQNAQGYEGEVYLVDDTGAVLISSRLLDGEFRSSVLPPDVIEQLTADGADPSTYASFREEQVVGSLRSLEMPGWRLIAETAQVDAFARIVELRNATLTLVATMLFCVGLAAWLLGLTIVKPLARLTDAATRVGAGDFQVDVPVAARNEVGYLTQVFNEMVGGLRTAREELSQANRELRDKNRELREVSITDGLTGLFNRNYLNEILGREFARSRRHGLQLSILMIDIDRFKEFNDGFGHQAGDELLAGIAEIFRTSIRRNDYAARYGGEEFLLLLTETGVEEGQPTAEKIRERVERELASGSRPVTVSVGVASFPANGDDVDSVVRQADQALYEAKGRGRNRVVVAETRSAEPEPA